MATFGRWRDRLFLDRIIVDNGARAPVKVAFLNRLPNAELMRDIKILLFTGYALSYLLAVGAPITIDPLLTSHVIYPSRHYPHAYLCAPIFASLLAAEFLILRLTGSLAALYASVGPFLVAIVLSFPIFLPEFPHGNIFAVGSTSAFLSLLTTFVWWMCSHLSADAKSLTSTGQASFEYLKTLFTFARQGAFACVTLFGALFFAAFTTEFKYSETTVTEKSEMFLLNINAAVQIAFYASYCVMGAVRYFFAVNLNLLSRFKEIATEMDRATTPDRNLT
jgi:hypothetical protein